jgi:hypothetical protein
LFFSNSEALGVIYIIDYGERGSSPVIFLFFIGLVILDGVFITGRLVT